MCEAKINWSKRDQSGNGTIFHDSSVKGHELLRRFLESMGIDIEMAMNISVPNANLTKLGRLQTLYDNKSDVDLGLYYIDEDRNKIIDYGFPIGVVFAYTNH